MVVADKECQALSSGMEHGGGGQGMSGMSSGMTQGGGEMQHGGGRQGLIASRLSILGSAN